MRKRILIKAKVYSSDEPRIAAEWRSKKQAKRVLERAFGKSENGIYTDKLGQMFWIEEVWQ